MLPARDFWHGRRVLLTGHSGFKGAWLALWLKRLGAQVAGLSLPPLTEPSLWALIGTDLIDRQIYGDIRDPGVVRSAIAEARPSIAIHMAAQPLVRCSYEDPVGTFTTNVLGTVHLLEALRECRDLEAAVVVTTDKVYANKESGRPFRESDPLGGHDPYSASKACAEIVTASYSTSFFRDGGQRIATARAGNVIGGGDWSADRLVPDVWRAAQRGEPVHLRNPQALRPWQHVLEPLCGYLLYAEALAAKKEVPDALNFGPSAGEAATVASVAEFLAECLGAQRWQVDPEPSPPEMKLLALNSSLAIERLGWRPRLNYEEAVRWTASWYVDWKNGADATWLCEAQIDAYQALS